MTDKPRAILIAGPTASGKSELAVRIAEAVGGTVINADALQVYAELKILTARPGPDELARARHALYGFITVKEAYSVARWVEHARVAVAAAERDKRTPILVGGTGLYFRALLDGLAEIPPIPEEIREDANALFDEAGPEGFRDMLRELDPEAAERLKVNDRYRAVRAYEVVASTGRTLAEWHDSEHRPVLAEDETLRFALLPERERLYAAIERRFQAMLEAGALEEAERMLAMQLPPNRPATKALGLSELGDYLSGKIDLPGATEAAVQRSRRYAKRQMTWIRGQMMSWQALEQTQLDQAAQLDGISLLGFIDPKGSLG